MKQKVEKNNWYLIIFIFVFELIGLNIVLSQCNISLYNNLYGWIRAMFVVFSVDIIYILYIFDFLKQNKKAKNILKIYKIDVNLKIIRNFIIIESIKLTLVMILTWNLIYNTKFLKYIYFYIFITMFFYLLYFIIPKKDNIRKKLKKLKRDIKIGNTDFKFILIDGNSTYSTFNLFNLSDWKISKDNIYINLKTEFQEIVKYDKKAKDLILNNTIAIIHELTNSKNILEIYENEAINNAHIFHVMAIENLKSLQNKKDYEYIDAIKVCDLKNVIQFVENLVANNIEDLIDKSKYKRALKQINILDKRNEKYIKNLELIYKYNFNNRHKDNFNNVPKEKFILELYKNAYLNKSPYQATLIFFNYITVVGRLVEYYLFAKYNKKYSENKIDEYRIGDNPSKWNSNILINIYNNTDNILYENLRERKYELSNEEKILIKDYLGSYILNTEIKGEKISYDGLMELFIAFRNKVEAHGIINDNNVYAVWNITRFFANMLNEIFKISQLECEYNNQDIKIKVGYNSEEKVSLGKYVIMYDKFMCFIKDENKNTKECTYMNYFAGEVKPKFIKKG